MSIRTDAIVEWLRQRLIRSSARGFVVGLSGGLDSAVVARLCHLAAPANVVGVIMPCHSEREDEADARLLADHFGIATVRVDLAPAFDVIVEDLHDALQHVPKEQLAGSPASAAAAPGRPGEGRPRVPVANVKPRLRMTALYFMANSLDYLVAGTGNRSELTIGYFTKHGDGAADLLPIGELLKSDVRAAARELGVPEPLIDKAPSAGLWSGQTDEDEMGFSYAELEKYLTSGAETVAPALAMRVERLMRQSEHKRALPPTPGGSNA
jgi:NAD+ synthase